MDANWTGDLMMKSLAALTERDFRNLYFARAFSLLGDGLVPVALAFAVLAIDNSAVALGAVLASRGVALVAFLLVGGVIADRLPRRQIMIYSDLTRLGTQGLIAALLLSGTAQVWQLAVLSFIYGVGDAFFRPTSTGIVPQTVTTERLQQANALIALTQSTFTILGPVIAGVIIALTDVGWAFAIDAATFLVSVVFVSRLPEIEAAAKQVTKFLVELREGWREFRSRTWLCVDGIYSALGTFVVLAPFLTLGPVVANNALGGASAWAAIMTGFGIGSVLGGVVLLRVRPQRPLVAAILPLLLLPVPNALMALDTPTSAIVVGAFASGLGLSVFNTLFETTVMMNVPAHSLSRIASIDWMLSASLFPLGAALAGPAAGWFSIEAVFTFSAIWVLVSTAAVLSIPEIRNFRNRSAEPGEAPAVAGEAALTEAT
jgi:MFS family permease